MKSSSKCEQLYINVVVIVYLTSSSTYCTTIIDRDTAVDPLSIQWTPPSFTSWFSRSRNSVCLNYMQQLFTRSQFSDHFERHLDRIYCLQTKPDGRRRLVYELSSFKSEKVVSIKMRLYCPKNETDLNLQLIIEDGINKRPPVNKSIDGPSGLWSLLDLYPLGTIYTRPTRLTLKFFKPHSRSYIDAVQYMPHIIIGLEDLKYNSTKNANSHSEILDFIARNSVSRTKRSVHDNEASLEPRTWPRVRLFETNPSLLTPRRKRKRRYRKTGLLSSGFQRNRKTRRKYRRRHHNENRKNSKYLSSIKWKLRRENLSSRRHPTSCEMKRLKIKLTDLGWRDWVISPKYLDINYCSGSCSYPLTKSDRSSNHARLQSLVHAMGLERDLPSPSCVPVTMASSSLLYFDQRKRVVLKNFPNMSVKSCGCR